MPRKSGLLLALLTPPLLVGCYRQVPTDLAAVADGARVRVELTRVGFAMLPELPGHSGPGLGGTLMRQSEMEIVLRIPLSTPTGAAVTRTIPRDVTIPTEAIVETTEREFSRGRTGLAIAGGVATLAAIFLGFQAGSERAPERPPTPPDDEAGVGMTGAVLGAFRTIIFRVPTPQF